VPQQPANNIQAAIASIIQQENKDDAVQQQRQQEASRIDLTDKEE
jgi:hypothetical protein